MSQLQNFIRAGQVLQTSPLTVPTDSQLAARARRHQLKAAHSDGPVLQHPHPQVWVQE